MKKGLNWVNDPVKDVLTSGSKDFGGCTVLPVCVPYSCLTRGGCPAYGSCIPFHINPCGGAFDPNPIHIP